MKNKNTENLIHLFIANKDFWLPPLGMWVLVVLLLGELMWLPAGQFMGGEAGGNDFSFAILPWWQFALDALKHGELPLWNPHSSSGMPFIANPQPGLFYPPVWLIGLISPERVVGVLIALHLWLAGWGMYVWLRSENASTWGAWFGAALFAFSGYFLVRASAGQSDVLMTQIWLPWCLWAYRQVERHFIQAKVAPEHKLARGFIPVILGGLPIGLSLLAGHTASFFFVAAILGTYALYLALRAQSLPDDGSQSDYIRNRLPPIIYRLLSALFSLAGMMLIGIGLAAIQLIPTFEFLAQSTRQDAGYNFSAGYSWNPGYLIMLLVPNFFGDLINTGYWGDGIYVELVFYVGVLPLILVLLAGGRLRHRLTLWLLALSGTGLLLALGQFSIAHRLAYQLIPLFSATRAPARAGFLFTFAIATLSGLIISWLETAPDCLNSPDGNKLQIDTRTAKTAGWVVGIVAACVILICYILYIVQRDTNSQVGRLWHVANYTGLFLIFFLGAIALLSQWLKGALTGTQGAILALMLLLLDLWSYGRPLFHAIPVPQKALWQEAAALFNNDPDLADCSDPAGDRILPWGLNLFDHNLNIPYQLNSIFSYDPMWIGRYQEFTDAAGRLQSRLYDLLRTRYVVSDVPIDFNDIPGSPSQIKKVGELRIYERPEVFPVAWLVHRVEVQPKEAILTRLNDPDLDLHKKVVLESLPACSVNPASEPESVSIIAQGNNYLTLNVNANAEGILVLSEIAYPGWRAYIDGDSTPVLRANYTLRAICVPAGTHEVRFAFKPTSLYIGAGCTLGVLILMLVAGWTGFRRYRAARVQMSAPHNSELCPEK
ncbi:MAG: YfhO family protein [Anaerolineae bacterium]|nr:YfhO family protein [Anaerolineae bacterium]